MIGIAIVSTLRCHNRGLQSELTTTWIGWRYEQGAGPDGSMSSVIAASSGFSCLAHGAFDLKSAQLVNESTAHAFFFLLIPVLLFGTFIRHPAFGVRAMTAAATGLLIEALTVLHIAGLCVGFGGAVLADTFMVHAAVSPRGTIDGKQFWRINRYAALGLTVVWLSGLTIVALTFELQSIPQEIVVKLGLATLLAMTLTVFGKRFRALLENTAQPLAANISLRQSSEIVLATGLSLTCWIPALLVTKSAFFQAMDVTTLAVWAFVFFGLSCAVLIGLIIVARISNSLRSLWTRKGDYEPAASFVESSDPTVAAEIGEIEEVPLLHASSSVPMQSVPDQTSTETPVRGISPQRVHALQAFARHAPEVLLRLARALSERRGDAVAETIHSLRAMSEGIQATRLAQTCARFENDAARGTLDDVRERMVELKTDLMRVLKLIDAQCGASGSAERQRGDLHHHPHPSAAPRMPVSAQGANGYAKSA